MQPQWIAVMKAQQFGEVGLGGIGVDIVGKALQEHNFVNIKHFYNAYCRLLLCRFTRYFHGNCVNIVARVCESQVFFVNLHSQKRGYGQPCQSQETDKQ